VTSKRRAFAPALAFAGTLAGLTAIAGCSAVSGVFDRTPDVVVDRTAVDDTTPKVQVAKLSGDTSIPILVNDQPITRYDIAQRAALMRIASVPGGEKAATEELVEETLKMYEAAKRGVSVPDARVDAAYASIAQSMKLSTTQLTQALAGEGIDGASLKKRLRAQMTWEQLVVRRAAVEAQAKPLDVTEQLLAKGDPAAMTATEYMLQQIVFVVPSGSPAGLYSQRRQEAEAFRLRFKGCQNSLEQAKQLKGVVVKDLGRRDSSQLAGPDAEVIRKTQVGKTTPPEQTSQGVELIAVCSTREIHSTEIARAEVRNEMFAEQSKELGKDYLKELRDRAIIQYR
jgi:peptidyl-prolyl cis-trans isomerase SurA